MVRPAVLGTCCAVILIIAAPAIAASSFTDVFVGGADGPDGTPYYRIPTLVTAPNGNLIALIEGRPTPDDPAVVEGQFVKLLSKVSSDNGATWSPLKVVASSDNFSYSDARPMIDAISGKMVLQYTQWPSGYTGLPALNETVAFYRTSTDNGQSWSEAVNIDSQVKDPGWYETCNGPGTGIQLRWQTQAQGGHNGRLITPAFVLPQEHFPSYDFRNASFYSDDSGVSWDHSPVAPGDCVGSEAQIVELTNGDLLMDSRGLGNRPRWLSHDGGATWGEVRYGDIPVADVSAGLIRYSAKRDGQDRDRLLFSAPLGNPPGSGNSRDNLGLWTSYDEGKTFINPVLVASQDVAGYSAVQKLANGSVGILYEKLGSTRIAFASLPMADIEGQEFRSSLTHYDGFDNNIDRHRGGIGWSGSWTGTSVATNDYNAQLGGSGLAFAGHPVVEGGGRMDLTVNHNTTERHLATPIDLNANDTTYIGLLVSQAIDTDTEKTGKLLRVCLQDSDDVAQFNFGVNNDEQFFLTDLSNTTQNSPGIISSSATYLVVLKIESQDNQETGNSDRVFLKAFQSGVDIVPDTDAELDWMLMGMTDVNSSAILDQISFSCNSNANWSFDELRIGNRFDAVAGMYSVPEPKSIMMLSAVALGWLLFRSCLRRNARSLSQETSKRCVTYA